MELQSFFREDYVGARELFFATCRAEGLAVQTYEHPQRDAHGRPLSTEVVRVGPADAARLLLIVSGAHGVEALAGAACQSGLVAGGHLRGLPADTAVVLVHVINCHGAMQLRRNTDGNVDLCRNFVDFTQPLPERPHYEQIHEAVNCPQLEGPRRRAAQAVLDAFVAAQGMPAFIEALMGGQFRHADGFSFGGHGPTWSRRTLEAILAEHGRAAREACVVEIHTGLGPWAYGTAVTMHVGTDAARARRWFGPWLAAPNERRGANEMHRVHGHTTEGYARGLPQARLTAIVLEFGTVPPEQSLPAMLEDHWLAMHGDPASEQGRALRQRLLEAHYPRDADWREAVWQRTHQVVRQALRGLNDGDRDVSTPAPDRGSP